MVSEYSKVILNILDVVGQAILVIFRISSKPKDEAHQFNSGIDPDFKFVLRLLSRKRRRRKAYRQGH
jgi:hypothetical protein